MLRAGLQADCDLRPGPSGGSARLEEELTGRLRDILGLLVVDEAQHLTTKALEGLRSLHDATGTGLALSAATGSTTA